jgi:hexosaminidase
MRMVFCSLLLFAVCSAWAQSSKSTEQLNLMPLPSNYQVGSGQLTIDQSFSVALTGHKEARLDNAAQRFLAALSKRMGMPLSNRAPVDNSGARLIVNTDHASKPVQEPGEDESYSLEVTASGAKLTAPTPLGTLHGLQTFLQLIEGTPSGFAVPVVTVHDTPRFVWRGLLIDVGRHFMPVDVIKRNLDGMEAVKLNVLHLHLSDYQGFRVESKKFPKLHEMGSDGLFYTQAQISDMIGYARDRGIRVLPEFDMPGHSTSWFVGYPELASAPGPYQIERNWGVFDPAMDPTQDHTYKFLEDFIAEMAKLFPDPYFHIGGDEVNGKQWDANPKIQEFMRSHGLKDNAALQTYFTNRVQKIVSKQHKIMVGWDEILSPGIPQEIVIQSWRGPESLAAAARQGYRGLLSNGYYIDLMWSAARHYAVDPMSGDAAKLSAEEKKRILGGEATMWSEHVGPETIDSRIWPRTAAIAERYWSPESVRDVSSMYRRLNQVSWRLDFLGLTHNTDYIPMLQRIANSDDVSALRLLADVVEPVKDYQREDVAKTPPTSATPFNRLVDAARPESETARVFSNLVDEFVSGGCKDASKAAEIRTRLAQWREVYPKLQPMMSGSSMLGENENLVRNLSAVSASGLGALDSLDRHQTPADTWKAEQIALLQQASKPDHTQVLLMVVSPIQKLVEYASAGGACSASK